MTQREAREPSRDRLVVERVGDGRRFWTETVGTFPPVYGERWIEREGRSFRGWSPSRSKLAAALDVGWEGPIPQEGETWLYLGAATGTTASHVADLVGPKGAVYVVEKSPRPFQKLLALAERWPNLLPILADARSLEEDPYPPRMVDGLYADLPQPDQVEIVLRSARRFLRERGTVLMALKTASMGRDLSAPLHLEQAERRLGRFLTLERTARLAPWHRGHYFIGGEARPGFENLDLAASPSPGSPGPEPRSPHPRREGRGRGPRSDRESGRWVPRPARHGRSA